MRATSRQISRRTALVVGLAAALPCMTSCSSGVRRRSEQSTPTPQGTTTVRVGRLVVSGSVPAAQLQSVAAEAAQAVRRVQRVWGAGVLQRTLRIQVAASDAEFRAYGGGVEAGAQIAATTTASGAVVLAPALFTAVTADGRVVVLTHEFTHVALHQATLTGVARWIIEGSAEFTAYDAAAKDLATLAPSLAATVRGGSGPTGPPTDRQFAEDAVAAYQSALAWCRFLADRFGLSKFVSFVRAADAGTPRAFEASFGIAANTLRVPYGTYLRTQFAG